jgi:hypothetical protein
MIAHFIQLNNSDGIGVKKQDICALTQAKLHILSIFFILCYGLSSSTPLAYGIEPQLIKRKGCTFIITRTRRLRVVTHLIELF